MVRFYRAESTGNGGWMRPATDGILPDLQALFRAISHICWRQ